MRNGLRLFVALSAALVLLVLSPSALGDETAYQLVVPQTNGFACAGFAHVTTAGTMTGCTPDTAASSWAIFYSVAADGSVAFQTESGSIWLAKPDGSSVLLDNSTDDSYPSISYDGSKVVFVRYDAADSSPQADPAVNVSDIYSVNSDGSGLQLVVSGEKTHYLRVPVISPDGSSVAYWCGPAVNGDTTGSGCGPLTDGSSRYAGIMRVNIDGSDPRMIVIGPGANLTPAGPSSLSWSPDSQWLALEGDVLPSGRELFEYHTDGSDLFNNLDPTRQIPSSSSPSGAIYGQFSPDGSQLLYMDMFDGSGNQGNFSYLVGVDGSDPHQIFLSPNTTCHDGYCYGASSYGRFIPTTATPVAPPPLVDMTHITVPSVTELSVPDATSTLASDNLTVGAVSRIYSGTVAQGAVVSQSPGAGAVAHRTQKVGPAVNLVVSKGAAPPTKSLQVARAGTGSGTISSSPSGISCGSACSHAFASGASVVLTATPSAGSKFTGWSGACSGTGACKVTMSAAQSVTASFALVRTLRVTKLGNGSGTVASTIPGISCGSTCSYAFVFGAKVTLIAKPAAGSKFVRWSGACSGTGVCRVTMSTGRSVIATFRKR